MVFFLYSIFACFDAWILDKSTNARAYLTFCVLILFLCSFFYKLLFCLIVLNFFFYWTESSEMLWLTIFLNLNYFSKNFYILQEVLESYFIKFFLEGKFQDPNLIEKCINYWSLIHFTRKCVFIIHKMNYLQLNIALFYFFNSYCLILLLTYFVRYHRSKSKLEMTLRWQWVLCNIKIKCTHNKREKDKM